MQTIIRSAIVNSNIRIQRKRLLPSTGTVVVSERQTVAPNQTVARTDHNPEFKILPLSELLKLTPSAVESSLIVEPGARISQGMTILEKKGTLGRGLSYESPYEGELLSVNNGHIILKQSGDVYELRAQLPGQVVKVIPDKGIIVETFGSLIQAVWSTPSEAHGILKVLAHSPDGFVFPEQITNDFSEQILAIGHVDQPEIFEKAIDTDIRALIVGTMPSNMFTYAMNANIPVIVTNGAGIHGLSDAAFQVLKEAEGLNTSLFPSSTEANMPEIIVPTEKKTTNVPTSPTEPLMIGQYVRLLRRPYTNQMAEVVHIFRRAQLTPIGSHAHGANVRLESNQVVFVPFANMEAII